MDEKCIFSVLLIFLVTEIICSKEENSRSLAFNSQIFSSLTLKGSTPVKEYGRRKDVPDFYEVKSSDITHTNIYSDFNSNFDLENDATTEILQDFTLQSHEISGKTAKKVQNSHDGSNAGSKNSKLLEENLGYAVDRAIYSDSAHSDGNSENATTNSIQIPFLVTSGHNTPYSRRFRKRRAADIEDNLAGTKPFQPNVFDDVAKGHVDKVRAKSEGEIENTTIHEVESFIDLKNTTEDPQLKQEFIGDKGCNIDKIIQPVTKGSAIEKKLSLLANLTSFKSYIKRKHSTIKNYTENLPILEAKNNQFVSKLFLQNMEDDSWNNSPLHYAALNDNASLALAICEKDAGGINKLNSRGETALFIAVSRNNSQISQILLDNGADPFIYNEAGLNSLYLAVENENSEILELVLSKLSRKNVKENEEVDITLWLAVTKSNSVLIRMLLKAGANPYIRFEHSETCLHQAIKLGNGDVVQTILSVTTSGIDLQNNDGNTALTLAAKVENHILTEILLKAGADPNIRNCAGMTALHLAVQVRNEAIVEAILKDNRTHVDTRDNTGKTPLLWSAFNGPAVIVETLLMNGADVNIPDFKGVSPLHAAIPNGEVQILNKLLNQSTAKPNVQDVEGNTPLHYAVYINKIELVLVLVDNGANPNVANNEGLTPLHTAAALGEERISSALLNASISVLEIQDNLGYTALHLASIMGHTSVVKTLLQYGANPNTKDYKGFNALRVAIDASINGTKFGTEEPSKWTEIIPCLLSFDSDPYICDQEGCTALHAAVAAGVAEMVYTILNHSEIGINIRNSNGSTALNLALFYRQIDVVGILLRNGADPYIQDNQGRTSLHLAVERGEVEIVRQILTIDKKGVNLKDVSGKSALFYAVSLPEEEKEEEEEPGIAIGALVQGVFCGRGDRTAMSLTELRECASSVSYRQFKSFIENINRCSGDEIIRYNINEHPLKTKKEMYGWSSVEVSWVGEGYSPSERRIKLLDLLLKNGADDSTTDGRGNTIIHAAVITGHYNVLEYFIKIVKPKEMNSKNNKGETPLHIASRNGAHLISKLLLANRVDPYIPDNSGRTALHVATEMQNLEIMQLILNSSVVGIDFRDNSGLTALSLGATRANRTRERSELLIQRGSDPYVADYAGNTVIHAAVIESLQQTVYLYQEHFSKWPNHFRRLGFDVRSFGGIVHFNTQEMILEGHRYKLFTPETGSESLVEMILKHNSSGINMRNVRGYTALFLAALHSSSDVDILLNLGADPYIADHEGHTALHAAVISCGNQRAFEGSCASLHTILALNNSGVNIQDDLGYTALHYASSISPSIVNILLEKGADPNTRENMNGWTPLHTAVKQEDVGIAEALLKNSKPDINAQNDYGQTPLHLAEKEEIVSLLIHNNADIQQADQRGWTVIHYSALYGKENVISLIISNSSANINDQCLFGETPLSIAAARNNVPMVAYLIDLGADLNVAHDYLTSPLEIAINDNNIPVLKTLCKEEDVLLINNMFGLNALHTASLLGNLQVVQIVHERLNVTIDYPDRYGRTPLHYAAMGRQDRVLKYLLSEGVNPLVGDNLGHTVLHYAAEGCTGFIIEAIFLRVKEVASKMEFIEFIQKPNFLDYTAIQFAAINRNWEAFVLLWNECALSNISCGTSNQNILFAATLGGDADIINFILERTTLSVNEITVSSITPAMAAAARGRRDVFQLLMSKGAKIDDVSAYGQTMLHFGAQGGDTEIIEVILNNSNVDVNSGDVEGFTALMNAAYYDNLGAFELLINNNADLHKQNIYGENVITIVAKEGNAVLKSTLFNTSYNPDTVLGLLLARRNANYDKQVLLDYLDMSSLHKYDIFLAAAKGNMTALRRILSSPISKINRRFPDILKEIMNNFNNVIMDLQENEELSTINDESLSPLDIALLFHQNLTVVKYIVQNLKITQRLINYKATSWTPLDFALFTHRKFLSNSFSNVLLYLLDKCKNALNESTNIFGWTIAHKAAWFGNYNALRFLKRYDVELNREDNFGRSPLHYAALNGHSLTVNTILHTSNSSINKKDKYGFTPLLLSVVYNHKHFFRRLSTISSDMPSIERVSLFQNSDYPSPMIRDDSYFQTTSSLIGHNADLDVQDKPFGWTALHWAVANGDYPSVKLLAYAGANINIRSWNGETPLFIARKWMRKATYNYLQSMNGEL